MWRYTHHMEKLPLYEQFKNAVVSGTKQVKTAKQNKEYGMLILYFVVVSVLLVIIIFTLIGTIRSVFIDNTYPATFSDIQTIKYYENFSALGEIDLDNILTLSLDAEEFEYDLSKYIAISTDDHYYVFESGDTHVVKEGGREFVINLLSIEEMGEFLDFFYGWKYTFRIEEI